MPDANKISGGRWDRVLRDRFGLKGIGPTSARISDDISPTFNFPFRIEDEFLIGDKLLVGRGVSGPTSGQNPRIILTNVSDNKLLIIERIEFVLGAGGLGYFGFDSAIQPFIDSIPIHNREGRWGPLEQDVGAGASQMQEATLIGAPTPIIQSFVTANLHTVYEPRVVLQPSDHCFMTNTLVNSTITATFYWREHVMEESESA